MNLRFSPPLRGIFAEPGSIFGRKEHNEKKEVFGLEKDGTPFFKEDVIKKVQDELLRRKSERSGLELQWTLNANFLVGNQYCDINAHSQTIEQVIPSRDYLERETFNQIAPLIETRVANLKKINHVMKVNPRTNELDDYAKAEVSSAILQHIQDVSGFEARKNTMISWNELCGNCFWMTWWNPDAGGKIAEMDVVEIGDDGVENVQKRAFYEGELDYGLITPYEIFPESIFKQGIEAQRSIILEQVKSVEEIKDLYGIEVEGSSIETFELTPVPSALGYGRETTVMSIGHRSMDHAERVITYFERPSKTEPDGKMIIVVGDNHLVYYGNLPYSTIPIVQCICREIPGQFFGKSVIEDLIPRQRAYNGCMNRIHEYIKRIAIQSYIAESGAIDLDEFEENGCAPGSVLEYEQGFQPPVPVLNGNLPAEVMTERYNLVRDMEYVAGVSQLTTSGAAPAGVTSGVAIEAIKATDDTRLSLTGDHIRNSVKELAVLFLRIYKQYATGRRIVNHVGMNQIGSAFVWTAEDINSFDIEYTTENELLMSEEMQKQRFFEAWNLGLFTDSNGRIPERVKQRALEFMKVGNYTEIMNINTLQIQAAQRENIFFSQGSIPEISEFDDHEIHFEEHLRYILQMDFSILKQKKPAYAKALEEHAKMHKRATEQAKLQTMLQEQI